ncbi:SDR family NAD(P)-dependent oxidoreductase [Litoribrevibacter albus]|uniref:3-oxoacyl-ACP reductase n=1 Tax=Litoribrevibacter albus TaxID=1473156 RepID=A0AA37SD31_9GAMM|nr:SDR family oxidoreductase [Litoribrevibacter albus]GLQ32615.1 3-oxoacyl-ACP reductase [Litoribrevibacter albus]
MSSVVWITGCASGLGKHLVEAFYLRGYRVVATDINSGALTRHALTERWPDDSVMCAPLDVTSAEQWSALLSDVLEKWGQIDYLLNVAGYLKPGYAHQQSLDEIDRHLDINVKGLMYGCQLVGQQMTKQKSGHIINIASTAALASVPGLNLYSASKFAVRAFSLAIRHELKPYGVNVSVICPDAIQTPMLTLQETYEEAAMTFSGNKVLKVEDIELLIFDRVIPKAPAEAMIPFSRGVLAKLGNLFPGLTDRLVVFLQEKGKKAQRSSYKS